MLNLAQYNVELQEISDSLLSVSSDLRTYEVAQAAALIRRLGRELLLFESLRESLQKMDDVLEDKSTAPLTAERVKAARNQVFKMSKRLAQLAEEDDVYSFQDDTSSRADGRTW